MIFSAVHWFMQLGNRRYELHGSRNLEVGRPVCIHSVKEVDEPLAGDVVADEDEGDSTEVLDVCVEDDREDAIHVAVSGQHISSQCHRSFGKNARSPFCRFPMPNSMIISDHPHITPPTPVYRNPFENFVFIFASA